jgi:hypothetical protein
MTVWGVTRISDVLQARPDLSQSDPGELVEGAESRARSLGMKSKQLLT